MGDVTFSVSIEDLERLMNWAGDKKNEHAEGKFAVICEPFLYDSLEDALRMYDIYEKAGLTKYKIYRIVEEETTTKGE